MTSHDDLFFTCDSAKSVQIFDLLPVLKKLLSSVSSICETANGLTLTLEHCEDKKEKEIEGLSLGE